MTWLLFYIKFVLSLCIQNIYGSCSIYKCKFFHKLRKLSERIHNSSHYQIITAIILIFRLYILFQDIFYFSILILKHSYVNSVVRFPLETLN